MAITVGLDFGTHQTKICIENSDDPYYVTYEFYEWEPGVFVLPSVIQINKDHTLSYGKVDMENVLWDRKLKHWEKPKEPQFPEKPSAPKLKDISKLNLIPMPKHTFVTEYGSKIEIPYEMLLGINDPLSNEPDPYSKKNVERMMRAYEYQLSLYRDYGPARGYNKPKRPVIPTKAERKAVKEKYKDADSNLVATDKQKIIYRKWKKDNEEIIKQNELRSAENNQKQYNYENEIKEWEKKCTNLMLNYNTKYSTYQESLEEYPMIFRYFKQATFSSYPWEFEIDNKALTVLYLSYVLFLMERRFGKIFSIQMGVPASKDAFERYESFASAILIQAIRMVEDVFENDFEKFLATPYEELLELIPKREYNDELKSDYGLIILPEAYAALRSLSAHERIETGYGLMLDIGGGTSDLVFFNMKSPGNLSIYYYISIPKGLNFFLEYEERKKSKIIDLSKQNDFESLKLPVFYEANDIFKSDVNSEVSALIKFYIADIQSRGEPKSYFLNRIKNRPIIYTGGGSIYSKLRREIYQFSDVRHLNKKLLRIQNNLNEDKIDFPYSVLATAYGLSIQVGEEDKKFLFPKDDLFAEFGKKSIDNGGQFYDREEYGLLDN